MTTMEKLCETLKIAARAECGANKKPPGPGWETVRPWCWRVTLTRRTEGKRRSLAVDFFQGPGIGREPTAADVLSCLVSDVSSVQNARSFEEWASDLGFDSDSRMAEQTFHACEALAPKVERFLGDDFETFQSAEH